MSQPPYGYQGQPGPYRPNPYQQPPPTGQILLDCSFFKMGFFLFATGPQIAIDGYSQAGTWGKTPITVPAGQHHVGVHTRYMGTMGPAELTVQVLPGQSVPVFYRAPAIAFLVGGAMGHTPQKTPGIIGVSLLTAVPLIAMIVFIIAISSSSPY